MEELKTAFIICSRIDSKRVPRKALMRFGYPKQDKSLIELLITRLMQTDIPVILAIPEDEIKKYEKAISPETFGKIRIFCGQKEDPLTRMKNASDVFGVENIIRVCHDKIFVEPMVVKSAVELWDKLGVDYLYSSRFVDGTGFEIIKKETLDVSQKKFFGQNIEHISYAIKSVADNVLNYHCPSPYSSGYNLLIDNPEDVDVINAVFKRFRKRTIKTPVDKVISFLGSNPDVAKLNKKPPVTIYTCFKNDLNFIDDCIRSVVTQSIFKECQYILVDDGSSDGSLEKARRWQKKHNNIEIAVNNKNIGLSSSSNIALSMAKGLSITRIDADDYYLKKTSLEGLHKFYAQRHVEAIYPDNVFGEPGIIQAGYEKHHIGGAIFNTRSINDIKFTDGLRGYEGLDFFKRAANRLSIGYYQHPVFFYRQHKDSMTKTNIEERKKIRESIIGQKTSCH